MRKNAKVDFDYNSTRPRLILAEYGRNVQNMVDYICDLPTKEERNEYALVIIDMMGFLNPHLRDVADFKHKLWDHLHIISDFKIDVDSPYPIPERESIHPKPEILGYPQHRIRYKHYGHTVETMIERATKLSDPEKKRSMTLAIANFMKLSYATYNKDSVEDDSIFKDLSELSNGALVVEAGVSLTKLDFKTPPPGSRTKTAAPVQNSGGGGKFKKSGGQHQGQNQFQKKKKKY